MNRKITKTERMLGRSDNYFDLSPRDQWEQDKELGILDWDGSEKGAKKIVDSPASWCTCEEWVSHWRNLPIEKDWKFCVFCSKKLKRK
jgi:hypothetical protein